ncbi:MAG: pilus assembly protein TadG-related protein [Hyphomicrobiaceae bacterium]|nr:pilus assembly protein TadG-related protein [Hyphomicrobiaceae bacterium]
MCVFPYRGFSARLAGRFAHERDGSLVVKFALLIPVLLTVIGGAVDRARLLRHEQVLQSAVDAAALAAAKEITITNVGRDSLGSVAQSAVYARLEARERLKDIGLPTVETIVRDTPLEVDVLATGTFESAFGETFGFGTLTVQARAIARVVGKPNICVLALEELNAFALWMLTGSRITGGDCAVFSNSRSPSGLAVRSKSVLSAETVCSAGGADVTGQVSPAPLTDCPQFSDPLAGRAEPIIGACDYTGKIVDNDTTLDPGVYCGGLTIRGSARVTLMPGTYVIKDGPLALMKSASMEGDGVSFFLSGEAAVLNTEAGTSISLSASTSGELAGLLFFASRSQSEAVGHRILSKNAQTLVGTIYLPNNMLLIDGASSVGTASAYTAIVVRQLKLNNGPHLVLNTNYDETDVPVPDGIRGTGQPIALAK